MLGSYIESRITAIAFPDDERVVKIKLPLWTTLNNKVQKDEALMPVLLFATHYKHYRAAQNEASTRQPRSEPG